MVVKLVTKSPASSNIDVDNTWDWSDMGDKKWHYISFYISYKAINYTTNLGLHIDKSALAEFAGAWDIGYFSDNSTNLFGLGFDYDGTSTNDYLKGFIYEIKFYNSARSHSDFDVEVSDTCNNSA